MNKNAGAAFSDLPRWSMLSDGDIEPINGEWKRILARPRLREEAVHSFLAKNAQLAFSDEFNFAAVISKLRLGADLVTDFAVIYDAHSLGIRYKLVEIEKPSDAPFTKEGIPSAALSRAIQQVLLWRMWIAEHQSEARRLFPSFFYHHDSRPVFRYEIIIGTRQNSEPWLDRRNALSESLGISIRSFDIFGPRLKRSIGFEDFSNIGDESHHCDLATRNQLACPFVYALSDGGWREMLRASRRPSYHFMGWYGIVLAKHRMENEYASRFRGLLRRRDIQRERSVSSKLRKLSRTS